MKIKLLPNSIINKNHIRPPRGYYDVRPHRGYYDVRPPGGFADSVIPTDSTVSASQATLLATQVTNYCRQHHHHN